MATAGFNRIPFASIAHVSKKANRVNKSQDLLLLDVATPSTPAIAGDGCPLFCKQARKEEHSKKASEGFLVFFQRLLRVPHRMDAKSN